jgi:hypothetical protein
MWEMKRKYVGWERREWVGEKGEDISEEKEIVFWGVVTKEDIFHTPCSPVPKFRSPCEQLTIIHFFR